MKNVMIDLETLGVTADAVILSIGATEFELDGRLGDTFYRSVSIDSNLAIGRTIAESTVVWWMTEASEDARLVFAEGKLPLQGALFDLAEWFPRNEDKNGASTTEVWSNGASFDIPMLEHAYKQCSMESPWEFWNSRCVRTYRSLPGAKAVPRPTPSVAHNALSDAVAQAQYIQAIHQELFGRKVKELA